MNAPIQGSAADIMKIAMVKIYNKIQEENLKSKMILQVHDEVIFDCLNEEKDKIKEIVTDIMENCVKLSVPFKVSGDFGTDWYETK